MSELKNCPFCGGEAECDYNSFYLWFACKDCASRADSEEQWNTRQDIPRAKIEEAITTFEACLKVFEHSDDKISCTIASAKIKVLKELLIEE